MAEEKPRKKRGRPPKPKPAQESEQQKPFQLPEIDVSRLLDIAHCKTEDLVRIFAVTRQTIRNWNDAGCPRNEDRTYNLISVIEWVRRTEREKWRSEADPKRTAEVQKLQTTIKILEQKHKQMIGEAIPRDKVITAAMRQTESLKLYMMDGWKRNLNAWLKALRLSADDGPRLIAVMDDYVKQSMNAFADSGMQIDESWFYPKKGVKNV
jgi:hypothetical protein